MMFHHRRRKMTIANLIPQPDEVREHEHQAEIEEAWRQYRQAEREMQPTMPAELDQLGAEHG